MRAFDEKAYAPPNGAPCPSFEVFSCGTQVLESPGRYSLESPWLRLPTVEALGKQETTKKLRETLEAPPDEYSPKSDSAEFRIRLINDGHHVVASFVADQVFCRIRPDLSQRAGEADGKLVAGFPG